MICHICGKKFRREDVPCVPVRINDEIKYINGIKNSDGEDVYICPDHFQIALFVFEVSRMHFDIAWEDS